MKKTEERRQKYKPNKAHLYGEQMMLISPMRDITEMVWVSTLKKSYVKKMSGEGTKEHSQLYTI